MSDKESVVSELLRLSKEEDNGEKCSELKSK